MSLNIELITISPGKGQIIVNNPTNKTKTNWEIIIIVKNFKITEMQNLNFSILDVNTYSIKPKEWKINIEPNTNIISDFFYSGSHQELDYTISNIKTENIENNNKIEITIRNNTDKDILIKSGNNYTFTIN